MKLMNQVLGSIVILACVSIAAPISASCQKQANGACVATDQVVLRKRQAAMAMELLPEIMGALGGGGGGAPAAPPPSTNTNTNQTTVVGNNVLVNVPQAPAQAPQSPTNYPPAPYPPASYPPRYEYPRKLYSPRYEYQRELYSPRYEYPPQAQYSPYGSNQYPQATQDAVEEPLPQEY